MADIYKMIAGTLIFVLFVTFSLFSLSATFPDLAPSGLNPTNLQKITEPVPPAANTSVSCGSTQINLGIVSFPIPDVGCAIGAVFSPVINFFAGGWNIASGMFNIAASIFTFDVPAFSEMGSEGILLRLLLTIPMTVAIGLMLFFVIKSVVPFVGGNAD